MTEIVKRLVVERGPHKSLDSLLREKGFYPGDAGWDLLIKGWNRLAPTEAREIELVLFRPSAEEYKIFTKIDLPVYAERKLRPASMFEILALVPKTRDEREKLCTELGKDFLLEIHGHYATTWLSRDFPCVIGEYGWHLKFRSSTTAGRQSTWYAGFRKVR